MLGSHGGGLLRAVAERRHAAEIRCDLLLCKRPARGAYGGRVFCDEAAGRALCVDQSFALQIGKRTLYRVGICTGLRRQLPHSGKLFPGWVFAGGDAQTQPLGELGVDRTVGIKNPCHEYTSYMTYCIMTVIQ